MELVESQVFGHGCPAASFPLSFSLNNPFFNYITMSMSITALVATTPLPFCYGFTHLHSLQEATVVVWEIRRKIQLRTEPSVFGVPLSAGLV